MKPFTFFKNLVLGALIALFVALPMTAAMAHGHSDNGGKASTQQMDGSNGGNSSDSKGDNPPKPPPKPGPRDGGADD